MKIQTFSFCLVMMLSALYGCRNNVLPKDNTNQTATASDSADDTSLMARPDMQSEYLEDSTVREEKGEEVMHHLSTQRVNKGNYFTQGWTSTLAVQYTLNGDTIWKLKDTAGNMATKLDLIDDEFLITEKYSTHPPLGCLMYQHTIDGLDPDSLILIMIYEGKVYRSDGMIPKAMGDEHWYTFHQSANVKHNQYVERVINYTWANYVRNRLIEIGLDTAALPYKESLQLRNKNIFTSALKHYPYEATAH